MAANNGQCRLARLPVEVLRVIFDEAFIPADIPNVFRGPRPEEYNNIPSLIARDDGFPQVVRQVAREVVAKNIWLFSIEKVIHTTDVLASRPDLGRAVRQLLLSEYALVQRHDPQRNEGVEWPRWRLAQQRLAQQRYAQRIARDYRQAVPQWEDRPPACAEPALWAQAMADAMALIKTTPALRELFCFENGMGLLQPETPGELARTGQQPLDLHTVRSLVLTEGNDNVLAVRDLGLPMGLLDSGCALLHAATRIEMLHLTGYERITHLTSSSSLTNNSVRNANAGGAVATYTPLPQLPALRTLRISYCPLTPEDMRAVIAMAGPRLETVEIDVPRVYSDFRREDSIDCQVALASGAHFAFSWQDLLAALAPWKDTTLTTLDTCLRVLVGPDDGPTPRLVLSGVHVAAIQRPTYRIHNEYISSRQQPAMAMLRTFSAVRHLTVSPDLFDWSVDQAADVLSQFNNIVMSHPNSIAHRRMAYDTVRPTLARHIVRVAIPPQIETLTIVMPAGFQTDAMRGQGATVKQHALAQAMLEEVGYSRFPQLHTITVEPSRDWDTEHDVELMLRNENGEWDYTGEWQTLRLQWGPNED
ncbi:MAG: hypothetical protein STHCBS139747_002752 [Sporothrix thermara]